MVRFSGMLEPVLHSTREFSVVALNIRKFINEIFGNETANRLLCEVKRVLDDAMKENEYFCRETADKFYILFRPLTGKRYGAEISVSVNRSKLLFYQDGYVEKLCEIIERYHVPAHLVTLEILEGMALEDAKGLNDKLSELKEEGFKISMDDFGSGYSFLNTLNSLDIDELKLDRGFLMEMYGSRKERRQIVLEQIAQLARKMDIITVAEGVGTKEDEAIILQAGCDYGQGYCYSKPICAQEFTEKCISSDQA